MKSVSLVFAATIIARLSSLISFPITARILPVAEMGDLTIWHSVRGIIMLAVLAGMPDVVAREAGAHKSRGAFAESMKISYLMLVLVAIGLEIVLQFRPEALGIPYPRLLLVAVAIDVIPGLFLGSLAAMGQMRSYVVCIIVPAVVVASLSALLVLPPFSLGLVGPLYAHIVASAITALLCLWIWKQYQEPAGAPGHSFSSMMRQSLPVLGVSLVGMSMATVDRYSIRWFLGPEAVAFYAVSFQVAALLSFGASAVRTSMLSKLIAHVGQPQLIGAYFGHYLTCGAMFAVALAALAPEIVRVLAGSQYDSNVQLVPMLCAAILALELYSFGQTLAVARRSPQAAFYSIAAGAALALLLVPLLCYWMGAAGVPLGLVAGYMLAATAVLRRHAQFGWLSWVCLLLVGLAFAALTADYYNPGNSWADWASVIRYVLAAACVGVGLASLYKLGKGDTT